MATEETPVCKGCIEPIEEGAVVAFGESLFHTKCFVCDKCKNCIENKINLTLLSNDKPVCDDCSYTCSLCYKTIQNEAILTDDHAYHSNCFKCVACKNKIKDLIFTQTKKPSPLNEISPKEPPAPNTSRKSLYSLHSTTNDETLLSALSPVTLSFFNNSSSELLDNLSSSLGANLCLNFSSSTEDATQYRISRASEILQSSLRSSSLKHISESYTNENIAYLNNDILKKELSEARLNLKELESDYEILQKASQQALEEFEKVKEEYAKETIVKRQQEYIIATLLRTHHNGLLSKKELEKLSRFRAQLEGICNELVRYRDTLSFEIDQAVDKKFMDSFYADYQKTLKSQALSVAQQRSLLHVETEELKATRDQVIQDLINLAQDKSEEIDAGFSNSGKRRASNASSIICKVSSTSSFVGDQMPTLFHIKKKGSTIFNKLTQSSANINNKNAKLKLETSLSTTSISSTTSPSIYGISPKYSNSSSQNITTLQQGNHSFSTTSFIRPVKCGVCPDKLWGRSEYRCDSCGFLAHSKCLSKVPSTCFSPSPVSRSSFDLLNDPAFTPTENKSQRKLKSVFGTSLVDRTQFEGKKVPVFVEKCVEAVEKRGLDYEGIYRKSGGAAQTRSIQFAFDQGNLVDLCDEDDYNDICAVTSALKQYFRELPNPLLSFECYDELIITTKINNVSERLEAVKNTLSRLPKAHKDTLLLILNHLTKVCEACSRNRMTIKNLSMVFAPTLMRHQDPSRDFLDISFKNSVVEYLLLNIAELQHHLVH